MVSNMLMTHKAESEATPKFLDLSMKKKTSNLERLGGMIIRQNKTKVYWDESKADDEEDMEKNHEASKSNDVSYMFRELLKEENELRSGCATVKEIKNEKGNEATRVLISGMDDDEWLTTVTLFDITLNNFRVQLKKTDFLKHINNRNQSYCFCNKSYIQRKF